jgi:hypothetical protein
LVSVIVPTFNRAATLSEAIDSILAQTYPKLDVVVVDDGSTDETPNVLNKYKGKIRTLVQSNAGASAARNRGISAARGEIISFLDSDDIWLPTKIEKQVDLMERAGKSVPCCLCNIKMQWQDAESSSFEIAALKPAVSVGVWTNVGEILSTRFLLFNQGVAIRREAIGQAGGFDSSLRYLEDYDYSLRLSAQGPWAFLSEPLAVWRESGSSLSQESRQDEATLLACMSRVLTGHIARLHGSRSSELIVRSLNRELQRTVRARRLLALTERSGGSGIWASILRRVEASRRSLFIRSPWFPGMEVYSLDAFLGKQRDGAAPILIGSEAN